MGAATDACSHCKGTPSTAGEPATVHVFAQSAVQENRHGEAEVLLAVSGGGAAHLRQYAGDE